MQIRWDAGHVFCYYLECPTRWQANTTYGEGGGTADCWGLIVRSTHAWRSDGWRWFLSEECTMTQIGGMDVATVLLFLRIKFLMQLSSDGECHSSRRVVASPCFASSRFILASRWQCYASSSGSTSSALSSLPLWLSPWAPDGIDTLSLVFVFFLGGDFRSMIKEDWLGEVAGWLIDWLICVNEKWKHQRTLDLNLTVWLSSPLLGEARANIPGTDLRKWERAYFLVYW